jgi:flagellar hook-associated protein 3 FlgL
MIRRTSDMTARQTLYDLERVNDNLSRIQGQLSSGKQIQQPEDDPFGAGRAVFLRDEVSDIQQYQRNINEGSAWLQGTDIALGNAGDLLQRVRELVVQAANGTQDQGGLDAIAAEIAQIKESLRGQANATFAGRYVFSGTQTDTPAYPAGSNAYAGNQGAVQRVLSQGQTATVNETGTTVFGPDGSNVFDLLDTIQADLQSQNRTALQNADLQGIDVAADRLQQARSNVGAISNRLDTQLSHLKDQEVNVQSLLSNTEDADMAKTMITFSQTQATYQAALQAGARVIQPSLLDYLQ